MSDQTCPECGRSDDCKCEVGVWPPQRTKTTKINLYDLAVKSAKASTPKGVKTYIHNVETHDYNGVPIQAYGFTRDPERNGVSWEDVICEVEGEME